ncbi:MAG: hemolysin family protein [Thermosynechococcaceae cyanobacterium MS004]|nr:hemolysin family protein [Thermosynechococcaceae cyanobacterium MS004]
MNITVELFTIVLLILVNAFFAAAEISVVTASETKLRTLAEQGDRRARQIEKISQDSTQFLATIQVGITLAGFFTSATAASKLAAPVVKLLQPFLGSAAGTVGFILVTIAIAFISLIFGELVPKRLALGKAETIALASVMPILWLQRLTSPVVTFLSFVTTTILRLLGGSAEAENTTIHVEEIRALVNAARLGGTVGVQEQRIIDGAVELGNLTVRAIMVPRVQMQHLKTSTTIEEAYRITGETSHTRFPVCEGDLDHMVGILHVKDLIRAEAADDPTPVTIRELVRPVRFVPETKPVADLLRDMKQNRQHLMIVTDEFGGTAGLVTLEDVLEEIVGEIRDEYDAEEEREFQRVDEHSGIFKIRASLSTVNNEMHVRLPREDAATLSGLFLDELEKVPESGDRLEIEGVELTVLPDGQRVQVTILPLQPEELD